MATEQEKYETARLGVYFEALKENPALQVLLRRLQAKAEQAREELVDIEPEDTISLRAAQAQVKMFKVLVQEIDSFIVEGSLCEQELKEGADS